MALPNFNEFGDLPEGVYSVSFAEVIDRFGSGSIQRQAVTANLKRIRELVASTGRLDRIIVFGSYVTDKPSPNDVDVILVMQDDFHPSESSLDALPLFDHNRAANELGASIFWLRPTMLLGEPLERFIAHWQVKRDGRKRGIVEVKQ
jgi:predicted nucleotidyltransferase